MRENFSLHPDNVENPVSQGGVVFPPNVASADPAVGQDETPPERKFKLYVGPEGEDKTGSGVEKDSPGPTDSGQQAKPTPTAAAA